MLKLGGYINIAIELGHIVGLFWADQMFEVTGIGKEMTELGLLWGMVFPVFFKG